MSDNLKISITASNQASPVFKQLSNDAKQLGTTIEETGNKSSRSLQQLNQRAAAFGAALGGATLLMGEFAKAAADDAASQARLEQSVTDTGASLDEYSAALEVAIKAGQEKAFTDDQTRDALVKLNLATNDTSKSIEELGLAMDLSRARGISLSQSAEIIGKAYQGQYGALSRMGIVLDSTASKEEALAAIQQRVAGQAQTYAETSVGQADIVKDKIGEMTEAWGAHAGALQQVLLLLPGLQAGYVALAGVLGGMGGLAALGPLALGAGGAFLIADAIRTRGNTGSSLPFSAVNYGLYGAGSTLNAVLPGSPFDTQKYMDTLAANKVEDAIKGLFYFAPSDDVNNKALYDRLVTAGIAPSTGGTPSNKEIEKFFTDLKLQAGGVGLSTGQYLESRLKAPGSNYVFDDVSGRWMDLGEAQIYQRARTQAYATSIQTGATNWALSPGTSGLANAAARGVSPYGTQGIYNPFPSRGGTLDQYYGPTATAYRAGGMGAVANDVSGMGGAPVVLSQANQDAANAANAKAYSAALREQYGAYAKLVEGVDLANGASMAFKATQDGLIDSQDVYGQQISEFSAQQNELTAARDILLTRQEEGIALSKEEQDLLDNYPDLYDRVSGGVDDATVAQGLLAAQYIENMKTGDELNRTMQESTDSTASLVDIIRELILNLEGVPPETKARLELEGAASALAQLQDITAHLNSLDGQTATFFVNEVHTGISIGSPSGPSISPELHGGVVGYNNGGVVIRAGEAGPEFMRFQNGGSAWANTDGLYNVPRGTYVTPAPASRGRGGSNGLHFNGPVSITVVANDPRQMAAAINEWAVGSSRS